MKQFFKITLFKLMLTFVIVALPLLGIFLYNKNVALNSTLENGAPKIEAPLVVKALYHASNVLIFPLSLISAPFWKLFGEKYFQSISGKVPSNFFFINWSLTLASFIFLFMESYFLSCLISFLINKTRR